MGRVAQLLAMTLAARPLLGQGTPKILRPEGPGLFAPAYRSDSLALRLETDFGRLDVIAERDRSDPGIPSGRYYIRLNGRRIGVASDESLTLGAPGLAAYYRGQPTIVLLSTYTGGQGATAIPNYFIKIILLGTDARGSANALVYSLGDDEELSNDRFRLINGPTDGRFTLTNGEYALNFAAGVLRLESGSAAAAASNAAPSTEEEQAYAAAMKSDLRNLITAEEAYFADSVKYTTKVGPGGLNFQFTQGNRLLSIQLTSDGWGGRVGNARTKTVCAVYVGTTPFPPAMKEAVPACR